jgi:hypothetical protein
VIGSGFVFGFVVWHARWQLATTPLVAFNVDSVLVGGGRERPDAHTGARECAQLVFFFVIFVIPESVAKLWLYFPSGLNVVARKLSL